MSSSGRPTVPDNGVEDLSKARSPVKDVSREPGQSTGVLASGPTATLRFQDGLAASSPARNASNYDVVEVDLSTQSKVDAWNRLRSEHLDIKDGFAKMKLPHAGMDWAHVTLATEDTTVLGLMGPPPHYNPSLFLCVTAKTHFDALPIEEWADPQMDSILAFVAMSRMPGANSKVALLVPMGLVKTARGYDVSVHNFKPKAGDIDRRKEKFRSDFKASMGRELNSAHRFFSEKEEDQIEAAIDATLELGGQRLSLPPRVSDNRGAVGVQNAMFAAALAKYNVPIVTRFACQFAGAGNGHIGVTLNPPVRRVAMGIGSCLLGYSNYTPRSDQISGSTRSGRPKREQFARKLKGAVLSDSDSNYLKSLHGANVPTVHANLQENKLCIGGFADVPLHTPLLNIVYEPDMENNLGVLLTVLPLRQTRAR